MDSPQSKASSDPQPDFDEICRLIRAEIDLDAILVFGSYAKGRQRPDSDLDIALIGVPDDSNDALESIRERIAFIVLRDVDLINFAKAPPPLQAEIMRNSIKIWCSDKKKLATEFMKALKFYQKLNEERSPILDKNLGKNGWKRLF